MDQQDTQALPAQDTQAIIKYLLEGNAAAPEAATAQPVGDVVPLPITPGPNAGPAPMTSAPYAWGNKTAPGIAPINPSQEFMMDALRRMADPNRLKGS